MSTTSQIQTYDYRDLPELITRMTGDEKHSFSATSTLDVLWVLYDRVLNVDSAAPESPGRDRFLLSKGHGPMAYYAVLAAKGFIPVDELHRFGEHDSILGGHPDRTLIPGVEVAPARHRPRGGDRFRPDGCLRDLPLDALFRRPQTGR